jgi:general secretion pathway protein D
MVFLRPVVLKDEKAASSITADRYEYIRREQRDLKLPWNGLLPQTNVTPMPPLDEAEKKPLGAQ